MDILEEYSKALELFHAKKFDASLELVNKIKRAAPHWKKSFLLEAYIRREQEELIKEFSLLEKLLPRFELDKPGEKSLAADACSLFGVVNQDLGDAAAAVENFLLSAQLEDDPQKSCVELSNALFAANTIENFSAEDFSALYTEYKKYLTDIEPYPKKIYAHKKIRVGFLSANFCWHVVMAWSWALISELDRKSFAVYCYSSVKEPDDVTEHFSKIVDGWRDILNLTDEQAAKKIRDDEIDILIDLSGHTEGNRLRVAAYRPATVQICGIGYMNSTGLDCFDYFLSDETCAGDENFFTEKIIRLPHSHFCYEPPSKIEPAVEPPCLSNGYVTFGSFNNFRKVTDSILCAWATILDAVPDSRLILKHKIFKTADCRKFIGERLKSFDIDLARVEMRPYTADHLPEYADVDIALDTFPYTGGVTTCEALYMGVPVVSLYGSRHGTRFGLSILKNVGLDGLAVASFEEYVGRAVALAGDRELLAILRKNLRVMMKKSPLMNSRIYLRDIELALKKLIISWDGV